MAHDKKITTETAEYPTNEMPGLQNSKYEGATPKNVKQEVKELNNVGAPGAKTQK
ncbi:MAG: hypothetical protein K1V87_03990 [Muribaculum sp.]